MRNSSPPTVPFGRAHFWRSFQRTLRWRLCEVDDAFIITWFCRNPKRNPAFLKLLSPPSSLQKLLSKDLRSPGSISTASSASQVSSSQGCLRAIFQFHTCRQPRGKFKIQLFFMYFTGF